MKIHFTASIAQREEFGPYYNRIIEYLKKDTSNTINYKHVTDFDISDLKVETKEQRQKFYKKALKKILASDMVVVEASFPSTLNVGHEVSLALERGKPTVVLYKKGYDSLFLNGLDSDKLLLVEYEDHNLEEVLGDAVDFAKDQSDTRFNFFISPRHQAYLDWISRTRRIPRSVYLRELIKKDMSENNDFSN